MLRMIIADDERAVREAIRDAIDWSALGISVIGLCRNGVEALDMVMDEYPDIVLTDIKMPGLSGLELIARVVQARLDTQFVILSGYGEFELAREAMRYGVRHYLLKPASAAQITDTIQEVAADCYRLHGASSGSAARADVQNALVRDALTMALTGLVPLENVVAQRQQYIDFENTSYELCYLYYLEEKNLEDALAAIHDACWAKVGALSLHVLYVPGGLILFFESCSADYTWLDNVAARCVQGKQAVEVQYERVAFRCLRDLLAELTRRLVRFESILLMEDGQRIRLDNHSRLIQTVDKLAQELLAAAPDRREGCWQELQSIGGTHPELVKGALTSAIIRENRLPADAVQSAAGLLLDLRAAEDTGQLHEVIMAALSAADASARPDNGDAIHRILEYIDNDLADPNLSLKWLAENQLFMNVDYLSRQFARRTGEKFSVYLTRKRIERAKQLLATGSTVTAAAEQVGFGNNPQYFSQLFRKSVGMTPSEFVRQGAE